MNRAGLRPAEEQRRAWRGWAIQDEVRGLIAVWEGDPGPPALFETEADARLDLRDGETPVRVALTLLGIPHEGV